MTVDTLAPAAAPRRLARGRARVRGFALVRGHRLPVAALVLVVGAMFREILFTTRYPAGMDSGFLYSTLPYFESHHLVAFTAWLPAPLGQVQAYSLYWLLGGISALVHHPLGVYKAAMVVVALGGALGMYAFACWLLRDRLGAFVAATLYTLAPIASSNWFLGHLDVAVTYALGPLAIWSFWAALRGARGAAVGLGLVGAGLYLCTSGQAPYWLLPLGAVLGAEAVRARRSRTGRLLVRRLTRTTLAALAVLVAASAVELVPTLAGLRPPYVSGGTHFYIQQLAIHAKYATPFVDAVFGLPEAARYLVPGFSLSFAPETSAIYRFVAGALVLVALSSLWTRYRGRALALAVPMVVAWLIATGPDGPIGPIYKQLYAHVPLFSFLRAPNRWLMVAAVSQALLVGMAVAGRRTLRARGGRNIGIRLAAWSLVTGALVGSNVLFHGVPTWRLPSAYARAYAPLRGDTADWRLASTPFYQSWMATGPQFGSETTIAADFGVISTVWHDHATLSRGGWDPRAARFVEFIYDLVQQGGNRGVGKLLGIAGVKYLGINPYRALEVSTDQNTFFRIQQGLQLVSVSGGISIYRNTYALPQAFQAHESCVVAGGYSTLGDMAADTFFDPRRIAVEFADQARVLGGPAELRRLVAADGCLVVGRGGPAALVVLGSSVDLQPLASLGPSTWARSSLKASLDIGAEPSTAVALPPRQTLAGRIVAPHAGRYRIWIAGLLAPQLGGVRVRVDDRDAGTIALGAAAGTGVLWQASRPLLLSAGSHRFALTNLAGPPQKSEPLTQVALVPAGARWTTPNGVRLVVETGGGGPLVDVPKRLGRPLVAQPWQGLSIQPEVHVRRHGRYGASIDVPHANRQFYTLASAGTVRTIDPGRPIAIRFRGRATGTIFYLNFQFDEQGLQTAGYRFADTSSNVRTIVFAPSQPSFSYAVPTWAHVVRVTVSTNSKQRLPGPVTIDGPYQLSGPSLRSSFAVAGDGRDPFAGAPVYSVPLQPASQLIGVQAHVDIRRRGLLVLSQAYHPLWKISPAAAASSHEIAYGWANAYRVSKVPGAATISFTGARYGTAGTVLSGIAWPLLLALLALRLRQGRRRGRAA
ncbi:MAG: hypothetical protein ACYDCH_09485 [Gaiellaceae bacterium]